MPFVLKPSRNPIIQAAWAGLRAEQRAGEKKAASEAKAAKKPSTKPAAKKQPTRKGQAK